MACEGIKIFKRNFSGRGTLWAGYDIFPNGRSTLYDDFWILFIQCWTRTTWLVRNRSDSRHSGSWCILFLQIFGFCCSSMSVLFRDYLVYAALTHALNIFESCSMSSMLYYHDSRPLQEMKQRNDCRTREFFFLN